MHDLKFTSTFGLCDFGRSICRILSIKSRLFAHNHKLGVKLAVVLMLSLRFSVQLPLVFIISLLVVRAKGLGLKVFQTVWGLLVLRGVNLELGNFSCKVFGFVWVEGLELRA